MQLRTNYAYWIPVPVQICVRLWCALLLNLQFAARQHKTSLLSQEWRPLRWWASEGLWYGRASGASFHLQVCPWIIKVKKYNTASQMARIKFTGRGHGKVSPNGISGWGSISIVKWISSENSSEWRNQSQAGLCSRHFFPSDFRSLWLCMKGSNKLDVSCIWF